MKKQDTLQAVISELKNRKKAISWLTRYHIGWLTQDQIGWLTRYQIGGLTQDQIGGLTRYQIGWLPSQVLEALKESLEDS